MTSEPNVDSIFCEAVEIASDDERQAYLERACGTDDELRAKLDKLIAAHLQAGSFMQEGDPRTLVLPTERPGSHIGPYKLLQVIGEGGMGVVYMAEQRQQVKRRVALKIIKPGMDTRQVIARFEAERQALALLDHPNIAKVLEAGATESGRPYFVMELVNGIPLNEFCDERHLTLNERLTIFIQICHAVQHSHQKGIIHRDLKPSNVLVTEYDHQIVPKVIDFGVAKATNQTLTEKTMFTQFGQIVGTLEYMSPEQAKRNQLDIDTRSDIYSLGVMLYELLTGETPFDRQRLRSSALEEMLHIIREEEPPRPSTRLSTSPTLQAVAANRRVAPDKLTGLVRGELDWIVMRSLDKDRSRRYASAGAFAEDLDRYLTGETVKACPPSVSYRFRKFAKRNKSAIASVGMVLAILFLGLLGTTWYAVRVTRLLNELSSEIRHKALVCALNADESGTNKAISQALAIGAPTDWQHAIRGLLYVSAGKPKDATRHLELARQNKADDVLAIVLSDLTRIYLEASVTGVQEMRERWRELEPDSPESQLLLALANLYAGKNEEALRVTTEYLREHDNGVGRRIRAEALTHLASAASDVSYLERAERDFIVAHELMPSSAMVYFTGLHIHSTGRRLATKNGDEHEAARHRKAGRELCRKTERFDLPLVHGMAAGFLDAVGETDAAADSWKRAQELGAKGYQLASYACFLHRNRNNYAVEFRHVLDDLAKGDEWAQCHRIVLGLDIPGLINEPCEQLRQLAVGGPVYGKIWPLRILSLFGRQDLARPIIEQSLAEWEAEWPEQKLIEFECLAGKRPPEWLLTQGFATAKDEYFARVTAAMILIGEGKRQEGIEVLQELTDQPFGGSFLAAILQRLEEDDSWPHVESTNQL